MATVPDTRNQTRLVNPDGKRPKIEKRGLTTFSFSDVYHLLLTTSWWKLLLMIIALYTGTNVLFALGYAVGGDCIENAEPGSFRDAYFFSVQTMATIGYGKMVPKTTYANILVTGEALAGMLWLAMATGLIFAKFSRPTARVMFSQVAAIGIRDGLPTLMFRMANERGNQIVEAQVRVVVARNEKTKEGEAVRRFHTLELSRNQISFFTLTWTVMHPIDERSPLFGMSSEELARCEAEIIISMIGLDETFSQTVHARHGYVAHEIVFGARFVDILSRGEDGRRMIDYTRFHDVVADGTVARPQTAAELPAQGT